jgi:hypothetical protein
MSTTILAFNIRHSVYRQYGLSLFEHVKRNYNIHLLPIITLPEDYIEQRAMKLKNKVPQLL